MASTIITKNGTGGAPSSLSAGELAINTTDGGFYYGSTGGTSVSSSFKFGAISASHVSTSNGNIYAGRFFQGNTNISTIYSPIAGGTGITTVGTVETGTWNGSVIASAYLDSDTAHLTTDQTFTGNKTFDAPITASGNISASGDIIATGTVRAKQVQIISANWKGNYGTDEVWIPLSAQPEEKTAFSNEQTLLLMPTSGHVKEIIIRTHMGTAGSNNVVYKVYIREKNKKVNGSTQSGGDITVTAPTQAVNNNTNTVTTGDLGTSHPYSQYDMLGISMTFDAVGTAASSDKVYITVVLENNLNDLAY